MDQNHERLAVFDNIHYTTVNQAVARYYLDPNGERVFKFLTAAFGLENPRLILEAAGMVFDYPQDVFNPRNIDKVRAFGQQRFWLNDSTVSLKISADADRRYLSGIPLKQITVKAEDAIGPKNQPYSFNNQVYTQAALGIEIPEPITITDFYQILWLETIARLRRQKILPDENQLPMFFVDMIRLYSTLNQAVGGRGMMRSAEYYPFQVAWPDLYLEDSGGSGSEFEAAVIAGQKFRYNFGLPEIQAERDAAYFAYFKNGNWTDFVAEQPASFPAGVRAVYQSIIQGDL